MLGGVYIGSFATRKQKENTVVKQSMLRALFYETYYFASAIRNVLFHQFDYLRELDGFYGDDNYLELVFPFRKHSALHSFIEFMVNSIFSDEISDVDLSERQRLLRDFSAFPSVLKEMKTTLLPIEEAFSYYQIEHESFEAWLEQHNKSFFQATSDDAYDYYQDVQLEVPYGLLMKNIVDEVFFILFQNRVLLIRYNDMISSHISKTIMDDVPEEYGKYFSSNGILSRVRIPEWVKRAVFHRDRGRCTKCNRDLTGLINIENSENYDHMVPLSKGGLNDVSNIQILCSDCNLKKSDKEISTSEYYQFWYPRDDPDN